MILIHMLQDQSFILYNAEVLIQTMCFQFWKLGQKQQQQISLFQIPKRKFYKLILGILISLIFEQIKLWGNSALPLSSMFWKMTVQTSKAFIFGIIMLKCHSVIHQHFIVYLQFLSSQERKRSKNKTLGTGALGQPGKARGQNLDH